MNFLRENPQAKWGPHNYSAAMFGLKPSAIEEQFRFIQRGSTWLRQLSILKLCNLCNCIPGHFQDWGLFRLGNSSRSVFHVIPGSPSRMRLEKFGPSPAARAR
jgi:hypothetical protein